MIAVIIESSAKAWYPTHRDCGRDMPKVEQTSYSFKNVEGNDILILEISHKVKTLPHCTPRLKPMTQYLGCMMHGLTLRGRI